MDNARAVHRLGLVTGDPPDSPERTLNTLSWADAAATALARYRQRQALPGGPESMARWQDTAHASAGARHTSALFARYDHEMVEVTRTEDSFGAVGEHSPTTQAYFDGFIDGYKTVDPRLSHAEEFRRERPDGATEYVVRFRYTPEK